MTKIQRGNATRIVRAWDTVAVSTATAGVIASALADVSIPILGVTVQNDPDSEEALFVGNAFGQHFQLSPGSHIDIPVCDLSLVYIRSAGGTATANWTAAALGVSPVRSFYIDATGGNDADSGRTPATAWQTIGKVNGETFVAGDRILLKRGETWTGTQLTIAWSGKPGNPITFGAYGTGASPVIDGNDTVNCIATSGLRSYIVLRNLECTQGLNFGFYITGSSHHVDILNCVAHDCGNDNIIFIGGVHDCSVRSCVSYDAYDRAGGRISCLEIADGSYNITVANFECYGSESTGIAIHSHAATDFPYNLTLTNINSHDNDDFGIIIAQDNAVLSVADANILVSDSTFTDNADAGAGANIWISKTGDPYPTGILFDNCESFTDYERPLYVGGAATLKRCAFRGQWQTRLDGADGVTFHNCTFYRTATLALDFLDSCNDVVMRNCIVNTGGTTIIDVGAGSTNIDIDYMLYWSETGDPATNTYLRWLGVAKNWSDWQADSSQDANSPTPADPLFTDAASDDFTLGAGSPAIDVGVDVGLPFTPPAPDLGAFERGL